MNTIQNEAIEFISDYQNGKYGYAVKGEAKAFMFAQAIKCETDDQLYKLRHGCEEYLICLEDYNSIWENGENCWIDKNGNIYYCRFGHHRILAENVFLTTEAELEKTHAKITYSMRTMEDVLKYLKGKPSNSMIRAIDAVLENLGR